MSTKVERKIASSETIIVRKLNGNGSKGRRGVQRTLMATHAPNQTACTYTNARLPENRVMMLADRLSIP
ncbi:MAG: hypothetical protein IT208_02055 [Chthonomonadales bacterium]|nr:hypothetical protein [Chthonomonadales bacterium]